jgi:hypothetical protein
MVAATLIGRMASTSAGAKPSSPLANHISSALNSKREKQNVAALRRTRVEWRAPHYATYIKRIEILQKYSTRVSTTRAIALFGARQCWRVTRIFMRRPPTARCYARSHAITRSIELTCSINTTKNHRLRATAEHTNHRSSDEQTIYILFSACTKIKITPHNFTCALETASSTPHS